MVSYFLICCIYNYVPLFYFPMLFLLPTLLFYIDLSRFLSVSPVFFKNRFGFFVFFFCSFVLYFLNIYSYFKICPLLPYDIFLVIFLIFCLFPSSFIFCLSSSFLYLILKMKYEKNIYHHISSMIF